MLLKAWRSDDLHRKISSTEENRVPDEPVQRESCGNGATAEQINAIMKRGVFLPRQHVIDSVLFLFHHWRCLRPDRKRLQPLSRRPNRQHAANVRLTPRPLLLTEQPANVQSLLQ